MRLLPRRVHFKVLLSLAIFLGFAIVLASLWRGLRFGTKAEERAPSSVVYDDEGEEVMADIPLKDIKNGFDEDLQRSDVTVVRRNFQVLSNGKPPAVIYDRHEIAALLGSGDGVRARRVVFHRDVFLRLVRSGAVPFEFFENSRWTARFVPPSAFGTNSGLYSGTIDGEPEGRVRLFISGEKANGTFETPTRVFRLIEGAAGQHYAIEERRAPRPH